MSEIPYTPEDAVQAPEEALQHPIETEDAPHTEALEAQPHRVIESHELPPLREKSSWRFRKAFEALNALGKVEQVEGWENYEQLTQINIQRQQEGLPPLTAVVAAPHSTDIGLPLTAGRFAERADVGVASLQTNQEDPFVSKLESLAGKENFFDVANEFHGNTNLTVRLDAQNFIDMAKAVQERQKTMIVASFTPHQEGYGNRIMPDKPGLTAVIVANLSDRVSCAGSSKLDHRRPLRHDGHAS